MNAKKIDPKAQAEIYWTIKELGNRLHVGISTVNRWIATNQLVRTKAGGKTLISETNVQAFLKASTEAAA